MQRRFSAVSWPQGTSRCFFNALLIIWWIGICVLYLTADHPIGEKKKIDHMNEVYTEQERKLLEQQSCVRNARPCPRLELNRTPDYLVDLANFKYVLNAAGCTSKRQYAAADADVVADVDADVVADVDADVVVVLIHSACNHFNERKSIRSTWGSVGGNRNFSLKLVFLLALTNDSGVQHRIVVEHKRHNDIVQGNFIDAYHNLTYKHVMGLKWVWEHCPLAARVMKIDDDIFVHVFNFQKLLQSTANNTDSLICYIQQQMPVTRDEGSKWQVKRSEYPLFYYEDYCSGWAYLMTADIARRLYLESRYRPFFWVDDVHVTGTLAKMAGVSKTRINKEFTTEAESTTTWSNSDSKQEWRYVFGPTWGDRQLTYRAHRKAVECQRVRTITKRKRGK